MIALSSRVLYSHDSQENMSSFLLDALDKTPLSPLLLTTGVKERLAAFDLFLSIPSRAPTASTSSLSCKDKYFKLHNYLISIIPRILSIHELKTNFGSVVNSEQKRPTE